MSTLKDLLVSDLDVFVNSDEFAEPHLIDGRTINVIVDNEHLINRSKKEYDGITVGEILYFVKVSEYGPKKPRARDAQTFDGRLLYIFDVRGEDTGMYEIILSQNRGE